MRKERIPDSWIMCELTLEEWSEFFSSGVGEGISGRRNGLSNFEEESV